KFWEATMKLGYFANQNDLGLKKPFQQVMAETWEIARTCDAAGWDSIWFTEHRFGFEGYEVCPNPVLMSADIAAHTKQIRLDQGAHQAGLGAAPAAATTPAALAGDRHVALDPVGGGARPPGHVLDPAGGLAQGPLRALPRYRRQGARPRCGTRRGALPRARHV